VLLYVRIGSSPLLSIWSTRVRHAQNLTLDSELAHLIIHSRAIIHDPQTQPLTPND
jgi:hypothetical protein